jgi:putative salt-induced outer membrane protein
MKKILLSSIVMSAMALTAQAGDKTKEIVTHTEMGYIQTNGNTKTKTFNLDTKAERQWEQHVGTVTFDGQYAKDANKVTKKKYLLELEYNYEFTDVLAFSYLAGYKYDKFSGFDYQVYTGPGLKYKALVEKLQHLSVEADVLYSKDKYQGTGNTNNYASYRIKGNYDLAITPTLKFTQEVTLRGSLDRSDNYFAFSKTAFISKISDIFSAGVSYKLDYVNLPQAQYKTDETLTFNLIMDY